MSVKCLDCKLCMDILMVDNKRLYRCFLCRKVYDIVDKKLVVVDVNKILEETK